MPDELAADVAFLCPVCAHTKVPAVRVGNLAVCGSCGASLIVSGQDVVRRARYEDLADISQDDLARLRSFRGKLADRRPMSA